MRRLVLVPLLLATLAAGCGSDSSPPVNPWTLATVPHFATFREPCAAGVVVEQENIAIYDRYRGLDLPADVRQVFESNRAASLLNHLPAFQRCAT